MKRSLVATLARATANLATYFSTARWTAREELPTIRKRSVLFATMGSVFTKALQRCQAVIQPLMKYLIGVSLASTAAICAISATKS